MRLLNRVGHSYFFFLLHFPMELRFLGYVPWEIDSKMEICLQKVY